MNKRIDLSNLGGFPLEQDTLDFMQSSYRTAFAAIAKLCGSKTILYGVEVIAGNVTDGWISYLGELIPFVGGVLGTDVVITETPNVVQTTFEDGAVRDVFFTKSATCGVSGTFPFVDLVPLLSLQNTWLPGDLKQKHVDNAYIAANFDVSGYGLYAERGWRILSFAYPNTAGRVLVNLNSADTDFDAVGKLFGEKTHVLDISEMPAHGHALNTTNSGPASTGLADPARGNILGNVNTQGQEAGPANNKSIMRTGGGGAHNNVQPSYVVLTLIKL